MAKQKVASKDVEEGKACAAVAYILVGIIWYFVDEKMKKNAFARFHVKQALVLLIVSVAGNIVLSFIPIIGWILLPIFGIAVFVLWILGLINALNGTEKQLPVIGQWASMFTF